MKEVANDFVKFWIKEGILYSKFKKPVVIDIEKVKILIDLRHEISAGEKQYWCYNFDGVKSYDKEARDYADIHGQEYLHACAVLLNSHITKFTLNAFMKLKRPLIPLRGFTKKENAVNWLREIKYEI